MFASKEPSPEEIARRAHECILNAAAGTEKDVEDWARAEKELSDEPVARPAKTTPPNQVGTSCLASSTRETTGGLTARLSQQQGRAESRFSETLRCSC